MSVEVELTCPLGSKCEEVKDNKLHRCVWFIEMAGQNPNTGEEINERGCAMAWMPILLVENAKVSRGTSSAVESFRNEMVKANENSQQVLRATLQQANPDIKSIDMKD